MNLKQLYPLLYKVFADWRSEPERPPLLLNGLNESDWELLLEDIIKIFTERPVKLGHPDILILKRDPKKQGIEVKQTREFIAQLSLSNYEFSFKLGIIPAANRLNVQSQNALLKTLEEPLKNRYLIMGTAVKNKLLPTILSRAMIINLDNRVETHCNACLPARQASLRSDIANFYQDCLKSSLPERLQKGQAWSEGKTEKINEFFNSIIAILHTRLSENADEGNKKTARETTAQLKTALFYTEQLERTSGANPKLLFEAFLLQMPEEK